jgi:lactoylglutathione lyase
MTARFRDAFPILAVADMDRSLRFYRDLLMFEPTYAFPPDGPPQFVTLAVEGGQLGLAVADRTVESASTAIWLYADDVDEAVAALRDAGVAVLAEPADRPWGERVASVADPDGYTVHSGAPAAP